MNSADVNAIRRKRVSDLMDSQQPDSGNYLDPGPIVSPADFAVLKLYEEERAEKARQQAIRESDAYQTLVSMFEENARKPRKPNRAERRARARWQKQRGKGFTK